MILPQELSKLNQLDRRVDAIENPPPAKAIPEGYMVIENKLIRTVNAEQLSRQLSGGVTGTYADKVNATPVNGDEFFQTDDARDAPAAKYYYLNGRWNMIPPDREQFIMVFDDFHRIGAAGFVWEFYYGVTGGVATPSYVAPISGTVLHANTGVSATGRVILYQGSLNNAGSGFIFQTGAVYFKMFAPRFDNISTALEEFTLRFGLMGASAPVDTDNGVYFEYDRLISPNWQLKTAKNGVRTSFVTTIPVAPGSHLFEIFVNELATQADYYINNVLAGSVALVVFNNVAQPFFQIIKSVGTTLRGMYIDYIKSWQRLTTSRP